MFHLRSPTPLVTYCQEENLARITTGFQKCPTLHMGMLHTRASVTKQYNLVPANGR